MYRFGLILQRKPNQSVSAQVERTVTLFGGQLRELRVARIALDVRQSAKRDFDGRRWVDDLNRLAAVDPNRCSQGFVSPQ